MTKIDFGAAWRAERETLLDGLIACRAVRFDGPFTLSSGTLSDYYVDVRRACSRPDVLRRMAGMMLVLGPRPVAFAGVALGGVPLAVACSLLTTDVPSVIVRPEAKEHGTKRLVEGACPAAGVVAVIEDVATSGGSILRAVAALRAAGLTVGEARVVVDRGQGAREALAEEGVELRALLTGEEILARRGREG